MSTPFEPSSWSSILPTAGVANKNVISHEHRGPIFCQPFDLETGSYVSVDEVKHKEKEVTHNVDNSPLVQRSPASTYPEEVYWPNKLVEHKKREQNVERTLIALPRDKLEPEAYFHT